MIPAIDLIRHPGRQDVIGCTPATSLHPFVMPLGMMNIVATGFNLWLGFLICRNAVGMTDIRCLIFYMARTYGTLITGDSNTPG